MDELKRVLAYIPRRLHPEITALCDGKNVEEIRLRTGMPISVTTNGGNLRGNGCMTREEAAEALLTLCGGSIHAHSYTLREGYVSLPDGMRAAVVGQASVQNREVEAVREITSISIRIPRTIMGNASMILSYLESTGYASGVLIYSLPGIGKTTLLRELAIRLSTSPHLRRVALIDARMELYRAADFKGCLCDVLKGYPKAEGITIAVRNLSPQIMICDEIGNDAEANAILEAHPAGVPLIASVHGRDAREIKARKGIASLISHGVFGRMFRLHRMDGRMIVIPETIE